METKNQILHIITVSMIVMAISFCCIQEVRAHGHEHQGNLTGLCTQNEGLSSTLPSSQSGTSPEARIECFDNVREVGFVEINHGGSNGCIAEVNFLTVISEQLAGNIFRGIGRMGP